MDQCVTPSTCKRLIAYSFFSQRLTFRRVLLTQRGLHVEFHQAIGPRHQALDDAPVIPLALIREGKNFPHGIRPIRLLRHRVPGVHGEAHDGQDPRSEEHTSELQSLAYLVCRLLLEKKKT